MTIVIALQNAQAILVVANAAISAPNPSCPSVQTMPEMVASDQVPVPANNTPMSSIPSL